MRKSNLFLSVFGVSSLAAAAPISDNDESLTPGQRERIRSFRKLNKSSEKVHTIVRHDETDIGASVSVKETNRQFGVVNKEVSDDIPPKTAPANKPELKSANMSIISEDDEAEEYWEFYNNDDSHAIKTNTGVELRAVSGRVDRMCPRQKVNMGDIPHCASQAPDSRPVDAHEDTITISRQDWSFILKLLDVKDTVHAQTFFDMLLKSSKYLNRVSEEKSLQEKELPTIREETDV